MTMQLITPIMIGEKKDVWGSIEENRISILIYQRNKSVNKSKANKMMQILMKSDLHSFRQTKDVTSL